MPNGMCYSTNDTQVNLKQPLRLNNHRIDGNKQNLLQLMYVCMSLKNICEGQFMN